MLKKLLTLPLLGAVGLCHAQTLVSSGGATVANASMSVSYAIGEIATATLSNPDKGVTQGFLQPNIGKTVPVSNPELAYEITLFPNPVKDELNLKLPLDHFFQYRIFLAGQAVKSGTLDGKPIDTSTLSAGAYFLQVISKDSQFSKTFKFIKI